MEKIGCDVLVAGAGASGIAAAHAAAVSGVNTILVEGSRGPGGTCVSGIVNCIGGLLEPGGGSFLNEGFAPYFANRLSGSRIRQHVFTTDRYSVLLYHPADFLKTCRTLLGSFDKLKTFFNSKITAVEKSDGEICSARVATAENQFYIEPRILIDCTGDGELSLLCGADELNEKDRIQTGGFGCGMENVDVDLFRAEKLAVLKHLHKSDAFGEIAPTIMFLHSLKPGEIFVKFSANGNSPDSLSKAREIVRGLHRALRGRFPSFRNSRVNHVAERIFSREGRRIAGEYVLNEDDILNCRKFEDWVIKNNWPIELWYGNQPPTFDYLPRNDHYTIPYRSLLVKNVSNLMVAGRCISASHRALGSARVTGACLSTGDICGTGAAMSVRNNQNLRDQDIHELRRRQKRYESL